MPPTPKKTGRPRKTTGLTGSRPPINELGTYGTVQGGLGGGGGAPAWSAYTDTKEYVPDLTWPQSVKVFDQMRTDSQVAALYFGITMPIRRYRWLIDPNGAPPDRVLRLANNMNLDIVGEEPLPRGRMKDRFSHDAHLRRSLLALLYGHMYFEDVGFIDMDNLWTLKHLRERMPETIQQINVNPTGGLVSIKQWDPKAKEIPVDYLLAYIWEGDGGNWVGRSLFRDVYKNWLIKDRLLRVDAINHERAGGVPVPVAPEDANDDDIAMLHQAARDFRVGIDSAAVIPYGTEWNQIRASSSDVIASVRYHDEAMARRVLMMVAMLAQGGTTLGSYALGEVFNDFFALGQEAIANWYRDTTQAYFIEDYWDWNYGPEDPLVPMLVYDKETDESLPTEDLARLIEVGALRADDELEDVIRKRRKLPPRGANPRIKPGSDLEAQKELAASQPTASPTGGDTSGGN
jgi:hypothetical protein